MPGEPSRRRSGRSHETSGNGRPRGMAIIARRGHSAGGTEPGLCAVWRRPRRGGRFGGANGDKSCLSGTMGWIIKSAVVGRVGMPIVGSGAVGAIGLAEVTRHWTGLVGECEPPPHANGGDGRPLAPGVARAR
jgi:hypothetical protein